MRALNRDGWHPIEHSGSVAAFQDKEPIIPFLNGVDGRRHVVLFKMGDLIAATAHVDKDITTGHELDRRATAKFLRQFTRRYRPPKVARAAGLHIDLHSFPPESPGPYEGFDIALVRVPRATDDGFLEKFREQLANSGYEVGIVDQPPARADIVVRTKRDSPATEVVLMEVNEALADRLSQVARHISDALGLLYADPELETEEEAPVENPRGSVEYRALMAHRMKPWVPGFRSVLIRPLRRVPKSWLGQVVKVEGQTWREPTQSFWKTHIKASHGGGKSCDVQMHVDWLTADGKEGEFEYAHHLKDGTVKVLGPEDFAEECRWWAEEFPRWQPVTERTRSNPVGLLAPVILSIAGGAAAGAAAALLQRALFREAGIKYAAQQNPEDDEEYAEVVEINRRFQGFDPREVIKAEHPDPAPPITRLGDLTEVTYWNDKWSEHNPDNEDIRYVHTWEGAKMLVGEDAAGTLWLYGKCHVVKAEHPEMPGVSGGITDWDGPATWRKDREWEIDVRDKPLAYLGICTSIGIDGKKRRLHRTALCSDASGERLWLVPLEPGVRPTHPKAYRG